MEEKKKKNKPGAGRPKKVLDVEMITKLSMIQCTPAEMGYILDCDYRTLVKHHGDIIEAGKANGKMALRRKQFEVAMTSNNAAMLIWLGKNWLNQQENPISEADAKALPWNDDITF